MGNHKNPFEKIYTADFILLFVSSSIPFGWTMSGLPPCIELACACWLVTLAVVLHYFWVSTKKWNKIIRFAIIVLTPILIICLCWNPVKKQYALQHNLMDLTAAETPKSTTDSESPQVLFSGDEKSVSDVTNNYTSPNDLNYHAMNKYQDRKYDDAWSIFYAADLACEKHPDDMVSFLRDRPYYVVCMAKTGHTNDIPKQLELLRKNIRDAIQYPNSPLGVIMVKNGKISPSYWNEMNRVWGDLLPLNRDLWEQYAVPFRESLADVKP
jgi:hypothetical protein